MIGRVPHWLLFVGIVMTGYGCDNVSWGGMTLKLEGPPSDSVGSSPGGAGSSSSSEPARIDYGPLLYAGFRVGDSARIVPVGEIVQGHLQPLPQGDSAAQLATQVLEERLDPGRELVLFHEGARIGTLTVVSGLGVTNEYCSPRAQAVGLLELVPSAFEVQRFLALEESEGRERPFRPYRSLASERTQRYAALNLAGEALNELRARWPTTLVNIRQDLQVFPLPPGENPAVVATFLFQDQMEMAPAPPDAYALMVLGESLGTGYDRTFTWYRKVEEEGKGAPRLFSRMDWDGDGEEELLLEVFGAESRWWAALDRVQGSWSLTFQDPCGAPHLAGAPREGSPGDRP